MKRGSIPLWLLRDLSALIGIAWSFWPLMIMVISSGRRAMRVHKIQPRIYDCLMQMLPIAEAKLRFALHRQAYRALGWDPRSIALDALDPITCWSDFGTRFEAYRAAMMDLRAAVAYFTNEHRKLHRIRTRVDANTVRAAHGSTNAVLCAAATHELGGVSASSCHSSLRDLILGDREAIVSKDEGVLPHARGPPTFLRRPTSHDPPLQRARTTETASARPKPTSPRTRSPPNTPRRKSRSAPCPQQGSLRSVCGTQ